MDQLQHFSHEHPLMFKEEQRNTDGAAVVCSGCGQPVLGSSYSCNQCSKLFILHKSCAELPREMHHPIHKHPFLLSCMDREDICDICRESMSKDLFAYRCKTCTRFDLHVQCASNLSNIKYLEHFNHEHALIIEADPERLPATCHGCKEKVQVPFYRCSRLLCFYHLHTSCAEMPLEFHHRMHTKHPLILNRVGAKQFMLCDACDQDCSGKFTYSCHQCHFNLDPQCTFNWTDFKHFSHKHPLTFQEDGAVVVAGQPIVCSVCGDPVLGPSYSCNQCSELFILHKSCAELPREMQHPIHRKHPLVLHSNRGNYSCDICRRSHPSLFSYSCEPCNFDIDIQCATHLSNIGYIDHFSHEHALIFVEDPKRREKGLVVVCQGCQEDVVGPSYCCSRFLCHYALHKSCAEMPLEFHHRMHTKHPLILNRARAKQSMLCDACDQVCSGKFTYSCYQCHFNLDPQCTFNWVDFKHFSHKHPLTFQEDGAVVVAGQPIVCSVCGDLVLGPSYSCNQCSKLFILHKSCAELPHEMQHPIHRKHPLVLHSNRGNYRCDICRRSHPSLFSYSCEPCNFDIDIQCATHLSNIEYIEHFSHEHALIFVEDPKRREEGLAVVCQGCQEDVVGPSYCCSRFLCHYALHKSCAELPSELKHPMHMPQHPLLLNKDKRRRGFRCDACNQDCSRKFSYSCFQCDFNLDSNCAINWTGFKYFSHEHPLLPVREPKKSHITPLFCDVCQDPILGPGYTCIYTFRRHKCGFNLHQTCAELAQEKKHPMHSQHPLFLRNILPDVSTKVRHLCYVCNEPGRFLYSCSECDFNLDIKCASNWETILANDSHKHLFTVLRKKMFDLRVNCDMCGEYWDWAAAVYYMCSICQLLVHKECASLPRNIKKPDHQHQLNLTWLIDSNLSCKVCSISIDKCRAAYRCGECTSYVAHVACVREESVLDIPLDGDEADDAPEITHFSHQHVLTVNDPCAEVKDKHRQITCEGCIRPITATKESFYSCSKQEEELCTFFLHKACAQLPKKMLHPLLHQHQFTLLAKAPSIGGVFQCCMCSAFNQGFTYRCEECASQNGETVFYLDLQCSAYWDNQALKHASHVHRLLLNTEYEDVRCISCGCETFFCFSCKRCEYHLCVPCARLPLTGRHRYDDHPLKLTYGSVYSKVGYYCQICEGTRDQKQWFYRCNECDFDCHAHCIVGRYPQVKLGSTCKNEAHAQHDVTLVDKARSPIRGDKRENILPCMKCGKPCVGLVFECRECNINIHREGDCQIKS